MLKKTRQIVRITFEKGSLFDAHTALRTGNWVSKKEKAFSWISPFLLVYSESLPSEDVEILRFQRSIEIRSGCAAIDEEVGIGDKSSLAAHHQFRHICHLVRRAMAIPICPASVHFVQK